MHQLRLKNENEVTIWALSSSEEDIILCCDQDNLCVKSLRISTGEVTTVFKSTDPGWHISNARQLHDAVGVFLCATLWKQGSGDARVAFSRKAQSGKFSATQVVTLMEQGVCLDFHKSLFLKI